MGKKERDLINRRLIGLKHHERLFRANSGMAWAGNAVRKGDLTIIKNARPFHGLPEGFPDLFGFTEITITPDMVGQTVAVFTAEEVKATGSLTINQRRFKKLFTSHGCRYRVLTLENV